MAKTKLVLSLSVLLLAILACNYIAPTRQPEIPPTASINPTELPLTVIVEPTSALQTQVPLSEADVPRVSVEEALTALNAGAAIVVDVRSAEAYQAEHIKGAISIPLFEIESNPSGLHLDKEQWIITYCT